MTYVAFLRAINVGGTGIMKMNDLQKAFTAAGCRNVRTFIASGNVLFDASGSLEALRPGIMKRVGALLGAPSAGTPSRRSFVPVIMFRALGEVEALVRAAPFGRLADDRAIKLYVMFMARKPAGNPAFPLSLPKEALEAIGMVKRDVLIVSRQKPNGWYGFPANWIERELGVPATARNWSTVRKLVEFAKLPTSNPQRLISDEGKKRPRRAV